MKKLTKMVLMFFLTFSGAFCYASGMAEQENKKGNDGTPISVIEKASNTSSEKGNSIIATINGHVLNVVFTENLGQVAIEVTTAAGTPVENYWMATPNGIQTYLSQTGDYVITFTLPNGDEYYGEFTVTD